LRLTKKGRVETQSQSCFENYSLRGEMTQGLYAHMHNKTIKKISLKNKKKTTP
jgi:hypothetical protein